MEKTTLFGLVILAVLLRTGSTTKCYNCLSSINSKCADPITDASTSGDSSLELSECSLDLLNAATNELEKAVQTVGQIFGVDANVKGSAVTPEMVCQKLVTQVKGVEVVQRSCQLADADICENYVKKMKGQNVDITHCSTCNSDACNGGPQSVRSTSILGYLGITSVLVVMWNRMMVA